MTGFVFEGVKNVGGGKKILFPNTSNFSSSYNVFRNQFVQGLENTGFYGARLILTFHYEGVCSCLRMSCSSKTDLSFMTHRHPVQNKYHQVVGTLPIKSTQNDSIFRQ